MQKQPKFSVIMPVYNSAEYLEQTILSWMSQTLTEIELICIDDASTDNSLEILNQWADRDPRVQVHCFSENKSAYSARKLGIEKASGL